MKAKLNTDFLPQKRVFGSSRGPLHLGSIGVCNSPFIFGRARDTNMPENQGVWWLYVLRRSVGIADLWRLMIWIALRPGSLLGFLVWLGLGVLSPAVAEQTTGCSPALVQRTPTGFLSLAGAEEPAAYNVLVLFTDDQRADTIAALGNPVIQTPNLDRLVRSGLAFDCAYMQGGMHGATCIPSRAMLLTGKGLFRVDEKLLTEDTWPAAFQRAGYTTFMTGKWHNGAKSLPRVFAQARSVFLGGMHHPLEAPLCDLVEGKLTKPAPASQHACQVFADQAIRFLQEHRQGPFFCYVAFNGPHDPHIVPEDFAVRYDPEKIPLPPNFLPQHPFDNGEMTVRDECLLPWPRRPEQIRQMLAEYYRYISYIDQQIGRILDALADSPHRDRTIVIFAADSGVARGSHGLIGKQNLYEHSIRVPLIMAGPGIPAGRRTQAFCYLYDVLPTVGRLCGVRPPQGSEGLDLTGVLKEPTQPGRAELVFAYRNLQRAIRQGQWKLIRYPQVDRTQLFDLQTDPYETTNLADRPEHAQTLARLSRRLHDWMRSVGDGTPWTVPHPKPADWTPPAPKHSATGSPP